MEKLSIGKMAQLNQVTIQTLRYYDKIGLLKPILVDSESNYRYYSINQCAKLDIIQYMKCLGMSLETIQQYFQERDLDSFDQILSDQKQWIHSRIDELKIMEKAVADYKDNISRYKAASDYGTVHVETMPKRFVFSYDTGINFYDSDLATWEYMTRELKKQVNLQHLPMVKFCNVGSILRREKLEKREFHSTEIFIFVDEPEDVTESLDAGEYLTISFDDFYDEIHYAGMLLDYASEHGYKIVGDYICEVVVELPIFDNQRRMFIKIQIPVKSIS